MPAGRVTLTLYYRDGCHLCESMAQALRGLQSQWSFDLQLRDIDRDAALRARYDEWVPVLCRGELEICHYFLDEPALRGALTDSPGGGADREIRSP